MKMSTKLWARFQSHGYPNATVTVNDTIRVIIGEYIKWLATVKMGTRITIVMTRSEAELEKGRGETIGEDILSEFAHLLTDSEEEEPA